MDHMNTIMNTIPETGRGKGISKGWALLQVSEPAREQ
jgi:hypothetical protein